MNTENMMLAPVGAGASPIIHRPRRCVVCHSQDCPAQRPATPSNPVHAHRTYHVSDILSYSVVLTSLWFPAAARRIAGMPE